MKPFAACFVAALILLGVGSIGSTAAENKAKCPISGNPASADHTLNVNGQEVGFCCGNCPNAYKKQINLVEAEGEKKCPISGKPASADHTIVQRVAQKVAFCCNNCPKAFAKKNGFEVKDTKPKKCPISGGPAKNEDGTSLIVNGNSVYFCCANCPKAYLKKLGAEDHSEKCAISGKPANADTAQIFVRSEVVGFCCGNCKKKYVADNFKDGVFVGGADSEEKSSPKEPKRTRI